MSDFEWDEGATQEGKVVNISTKRDNKGLTDDYKKELKIAGGYDVKLSWSARNVDEKNPLNRDAPFLEGDIMDNQDNKYKDLKEDIRESERRIQRDVSEREQRFEKSMERFSADSKEREERYINLVEVIRQENNEFKNDIKNEMNGIRVEINNTRGELSNLTKHNESLATTNKWSNVATIIGISAIVVTIIVALITFFIMI